MAGGDIDLYRNPDHRAWAAEFCRIAAEKGFDPLRQDDIDWVGSWIANAMMHGHDRANCIGVFALPWQPGKSDRVRHLTVDEQKAMQSALRKSGKIVGRGKALRKSTP